MPWSGVLYLIAAGVAAVVTGESGCESRGGAICSCGDYTGCGSVSGKVCTYGDGSDEPFIVIIALPAASLSAGDSEQSFSTLGFRSRFLIILAIFRFLQHVSNTRAIASTVASSSFMLCQSSTSFRICERDNSTMITNNIIKPNLLKAVVS